jgi:hypothetical protein
MEFTSSGFTSNLEYARIEVHSKDHISNPRSGSSLFIWIMSGSSASKSNLVMLIGPMLTAYFNSQIRYLTGISILKAIKF